MNVSSAIFVTSAVKPNQYPEGSPPEIAFAGRSNSGKSSLINTLVNQKRLARTSSEPGRTQLLNFFLINNSISFVDLPGYGYAKVPEAVRLKWKPMVETYLSGRSNLRALVLVMDIRRIPGPQELELISWVKPFGIACIPVMSKCDKLSNNEQIKQQAAAVKALGPSGKDLLVFSAKTRKGKEALWAAIERMLNPND
jgi:GTP-binding protein